jgi:hypothetical protein
MKPILTTSAALALAMAAALAACAPSAPTATQTATAEPQALASYPGPTFLENLTVAADGAILFTNYTGQAIERLPAGGGAAGRFAALDVHPISILPFGEGYIVAAQTVPFTQGPAAIGTGVLLFLDASGAVTQRLPIPEVGFPNGMVTLPNRAVLIADSAKAKIVRLDVSARIVTPWFSDPALAPQTTPNFLPGANGLKLQNGALIISSSATRTLYRLGLTVDGAPQGALTLVVENLPGADDFVVLPEGGFLVTTHGDRVVRVGADGAVSDLTTDPLVRGNTALALIGESDARRAVILGTGGFSEGLNQDAVVLSVPVGR